MPRIRHLVLAFVAGTSWSLPGAAELEVSGVSEEVERNIRAFATIASEPCDAELWLIRRHYRDLDSEVRKALEPFGFYNPTITAELAKDEACWHATLAVEPGEPVRFRSVDIAISGEASRDEAFADLAASPAMTPGAPLRHSDYDRLKRTLLVRAADRAYVDAEFTESRLDIWPEQNAADVSLQFDSGPRYRLGDISVEQDFLDPKVVFGYLDLEPGSYFDSSDLAQARRDLSDSAYFGRIDLSLDPENATDGAIPLRLSLQPGTRIEYTVGVGASTDTSVRFRAGFRNNRVNSRGHRIISDFGGSPVIQGISAEYRIPLSDPRREWFSITSTLVNEETDTFDSEAQRVGARWTKAMTDTWLRTLSLDVSNESYALGEDIDTSRTIVPGISFDQKMSDKDIFPTRGRRLGAELSGTDEVIGSTTSYLQTKIWMRWIRSFGTGNRLLMRLDAGVTSSKNFSRLPPSVRFFAGGDQSVRGFDYNSLGPTDTSGSVIGGTNLLVASVEYERHLSGNFYWAAFDDAGNAFDDTDFDPETGAGLGLKWRSPLGPVRIYLGYPVTGDDTNVRVHLRLGADL